jgi:glycosyltransferase involved in cell wall biosynthesis
VKFLNNTLLILTPGFPKDESDSTCLPFLQSFVLSLKQQFPSLTIKVFSFQYPYRVSSYKWKGVDIFSFNGHNKGGFQRILLRTNIKKAIKKIAAEENILGALSFWLGECTVLSQWVAKEYHVNHYCWLQGRDAQKENKYAKSLSIKPDELIALSDFLAEEFETNHAIRPQHIIPPGVDIPLNNTLDKNIDIIACGSLIALKRFEIVIDAIKELSIEKKDIRAVIIGDGPEKNNLKNKIQALQMDAHITLMGELPHEKVIEVMQQSKILLHTSSYEGFGVVCLEALSCQCHVISLHSPMKKTIPGWYVVSSVDDMVAKTKELLMSPAETTHHNEYSIQRSVNEVMKLFS